MEEITLLCQRLVTGDLLIGDFRIKMSILIRRTSEEDCRSLARAALSRPYEFTRKD